MSISFHRYLCYFFVTTKCTSHSVDLSQIVIGSVSLVGQLIGQMVVDWSVGVTFIQSIYLSVILSVSLSVS